MSSASALRTAFDRQIGWCAGPSPFTARLLTILRDDLVAGGLIASLLGDWPGDPTRDAVSLRLAAAFHFLVLSGAEPALARHYPPHAQAAGLGAEVLAAAARRRDVLARFIASPPQTNEVGRSGVLLGGFLVVARQTGLPLRLLEIGASAGLNSAWDRYAYDIGGTAWGDLRSPVRIAPHWTGPQPPLDVVPAIATRAACDRTPIDLRDPGERLRLTAFVWPDQIDRLARIEAAIALCAREGVHVVRAEASMWLQAQLGATHPGAATVVFHSVLWQYLSAGDQDRITAVLQSAGAAAAPEAPLAWLRFEPVPGSDAMELRLTLWPAGEDTLLATGQAHGASVTWLGAELA